MHDPTESAEGNKPNDPGENKKKQSRQQAPLDQLAQPRNQKTGQRGDHIAG
jgi:hypothetical protein